MERKGRQTQQEAASHIAFISGKQERTESEAGPTFATEAPPLKHDTVFPDTTSWRSSVQIHEPIRTITMTKSLIWQIELKSPALGHGLLVCLLACLCCTKTEVTFTSGHLSKSPAHSRIQCLLCHTSLSATRRPFVHPLFSFDTYVGGTGPSPILSQCSHTSHVPVSIMCVIFRSKTFSQTHIASHSIRSMNSTQIISLLPQQIRNNWDEDNTATALFQLF